MTRGQAWAARAAPAVLARQDSARGGNGRCPPPAASAPLPTGLRPGRHNAHAFGPRAGVRDILRRLFVAMPPTPVTNRGHFRAHCSALATRTRKRRMDASAVANNACKTPTLTTGPSVLCRLCNNAPRVTLGTRAGTRAYSDVGLTGRACRALSPWAAELLPRLPSPAGQLGGISASTMLRAPVSPHNADGQPYLTFSACALRRRRFHHGTHDNDAADNVCRRFAA